MPNECDALFADWFEILSCFLLYVTDNCSLESVRHSQVGRVLSACGDKTLVSAHIAFVKALPRQTIGTGDELMAAYGQELFWGLLPENDEHCVLCFRRHHDEPGNPLVQCSGVNEQGEACRVSRHRRCFPHPYPTEQELADHAVHFYCSNHFASFAVPPRRASPPRLAPPVFTSFVSMALTPPCAKADHHVELAVSARGASSSAEQSRAEPPTAPPPARRSLASSFDDCQSHPACTDRSSLSYSLPLAADFEEEVDMTDGAAGALADEAELEPENFVPGSESDDEDQSDPSQFSDGDASDAPAVPIRSFGRRSLAEQVDASDAAPPKIKLTVRNLQQAQELTDFAENCSDLNPAQRAKVQALLHEHGGNKKRPWYISRQMHKNLRLIRQSSADRNVIPAASRAASVVSRELQDDDAASVVSGASVDSASSTRNRWFTSRFLALDWAEYRSCCGRPEVVRKVLPLALPTHSSVSVLQMFHHRLLHRAIASDAESYNKMLQNALDNPNVPWCGGTVCASCFRAVTGVSRSALFKGRTGLRDGSVLGEVAAAQSVRPREQVVRVARLLLDYAKKVGQNPPNPRSKDEHAQLWVLPESRVCDLQQSLVRFEKELKNHDPDLKPISATTLSRAITVLQQKSKITISVTKSKDLCRCNDCESFDNLLRSKDLPAADRKSIEAQRQAHLNAMKKQRKHVDDMKKKATAQPTELFCVMLDGMDQSKTQLPSRVRYSKAIGDMPRLKVHIVGAFCFGGPVPVMGLVNFPDLRKDSSLSVTTLEKILDLQWVKFEEQWSARDAADAAAAAGPAAAAAAESTYDGIGMIWPRRLHVTFDNAGGECKNQWMFRYLGALVLHNVFELITVTTLLVGHTHDIVDQMFSVWAKLLRIHDAETYEKMRKLFHEKYHARIKSLVAIMTGDLTADEIKEAGLNVDAAADAVQEERLADGAAEWSPAAAAKLQEFAQDVCKDTGMNPEITLQTLSVNVQSWLAQANGASKDPDRALKNISVPHVFAVEKDKDSGDVYLYNKFLVDSTDHSHRGEQHHYMQQVSGSYTSRALLYRADELIQCDPSRHPPLKIHTDELRGTVDALRNQNGMTSGESEEFLTMLQGFDDAQTNISTACYECSNLVQTLTDIGTVKRGRNASKDELAAAKEKEKERQAANKQLGQHLVDPAFKAAHSALVVDQWWTKWLVRVRDHIQPAFIKRGVIFDPRHKELPYHIHPLGLVSNGAEPPLFEADKRVDLSWLQTHGAPQIDDIAIIRGDEPRSPVWIGKIIGTSDEKEDKAEGAAVEAAPAAASFGRRHHLEARAAAVAAASGAAAVPTLSALPRYRVQWWDVLSADCAALRLNDEDYWKQEFAKHNTTEEATRARAAANGPPALGWVVDKYKSVHFAPKNVEELGDAAPTALIVWGRQSELLTESGKLKPPVFERVRTDLTQGDDADPEPQVASASKKPKARKSSQSETRARGKRLRVDKGAGAAASPMPAPRSRPMRAAAQAATRAVRDSMIDGEDAAEEADDDDDDASLTLEDDLPLTRFVPPAAPLVGIEPNPGPVDLDDEIILCFSSGAHVPPPSILINAKGSRKRMVPRTRRNVSFVERCTICHVYGMPRCQGVARCNLCLEHGGVCACPPRFTQEWAIAVADQRAAEQARRDEQALDLHRYRQRALQRETDEFRDAVHSLQPPPPSPRTPSPPPPTPLPPTPPPSAGPEPLLSPFAISQESEMHLYDSDSDDPDSGSSPASQSPPQFPCSTQLFPLSPLRPPPECLSD